MKDKTLKILLGIIALNLTVQTLKDVELIPTAYAQSGNVQRIEICGTYLSKRQCLLTSEFGDIFTNR